MSKRKPKVYWNRERIDWNALDRQIQQLDRHAARPPWSWSVPYRARPKIKAPSPPRQR